MPNESKKNAPRDNNINLRLDKKCFEVLVEEASLDHLPLGTYASKIVNRYLDFYLKLEKRGDVPMPSVILKKVYNSIQDDKIVEIKKITKEFGQDNLKLTGNAKSPDSIMYALKRWFAYTSINFRIIPDKVDKNLVRISSRHELGKNWSEITSNSIIEVLKDAGAECVIDELNKNIFSINVKKKST